MMSTFKDPGCGCCTGWIGILKNAGFNVTGEDRTGRFLTAFKIENNVPEVMMSCHTAKVGGYFIEGHVPVRDIKRLLRDRPDALGLAMPGMPYRSPGMGPDEEREAYDVFVVGKDDNITVFQHYPQAGKAA